MNGGAPNFSLLRESLPAARLERFREMLKSTTNIILTAVSPPNLACRGQPKRVPVSAKTRMQVGKKLGHIKISGHG
jgi:hypothetical protein